MDSPAGGWYNLSMSPGGKRALIYLAVVLGVVGVLWALLPSTEEEPDDPERRGASREAPRPPGRGRSLKLPKLPGGDREPQLLTLVQGQVLDGHSGAAVPEVQLAFRSRAASASGVTDGKGTYRVELPGGTYRVSLKAASHIPPAAGPRVQVVTGEPVRWLDFTVYRLASLAGRVVDDGGRPLSGATTRVERARGARRFKTAGIKTLTDAEGRFTLEVPPGEVVLRADAGELGAALSSPVYARPGAHLEGITIRIARGLSLTGRVMGPGNQRVNGAAVLLRDELGLRRLPCDGEGRFAAGGLTAGFKRVQATARGYSPSQVTRIRLQPGRPFNLVLQVGMAKGVGGRVVDEEDQPVGGVEVSVRPGSPGAQVAHLEGPRKQTTAADGQFMFTAVPNTPLVLSARGPDNVKASRSGVAPGSYDVVLRLRATGTIVGKVTDGADGRAVRDFTVRIAGAQGTGDPYGERPRVRVVSPTGSYTIADLVSGTYRLTFSAPGYGGVDRRKVGVIAGHNTQLDVTLDAGGTVTGVVVDPRGAEIPGVTVRLDTGWFGEAAVTGADGRFRLPRVSRGRRSLTALHPRYDTRIVSGISVFAGKTAEVRVALNPRSGRRPGLRLSGIGVVISHQGGKLTVVKALDGGPARVAGLTAGDVVLTINGDQMSFQRAIEAIRGLIGTPVRLKIQRGDRTFEVDVIRDEVTVPGKK